ncbi:MAG: hypothetical protein NUV63_12140 [Gallionella sp.]|nr:hypothetical protein [Gallionella sp.]
MNKRELDLLEKVFAAQIDSAVSGEGLWIFQTKSKLAGELEKSGYLKKETIVLGGRFPITVTGYSLTLLGNFTYCMSDRCADDIPA